MRFPIARGACVQKRARFCADNVSQSGPLPDIATPVFFRHSGCPPTIPCSCQARYTPGDGAESLWAGFTPSAQGNSRLGGAPSRKGAASRVIRQVSSSPARAAALAQRTALGVELFAVLIDLLRQRRPLRSRRPRQSLLEHGDLVLEHLDLLFEWSAGIPHRRRRVRVAAVPVGIGCTATSHRSILSSRSPITYALAPDNCEASMPRPRATRTPRSASILDK